MDLQPPAKGCGKVPQVVLVAGHDQAVPGETKYNHGRINDVAGSGYPACTACPAGVVLAHRLYVTAPQQPGQVVLRPAAPGLSENRRRNDRPDLAAQGLAMQCPEIDGFASAASSAPVS
jgi:hypothetical protein